MNKIIKEHVHKLIGIATSILIGILLYGIFFFIFHPFWISGNSMEPTLHNGELVFCKSDFSIERNNIYIISADNKKCIKRLIGIPGDTISCINGTIYINGEKEENEFPPIEEKGILKSTITLNDDEYFFLGDNRNFSIDSKTYGPIKKENILYIVKTTNNNL